MFKCPPFFPQYFTWIWSGRNSFLFCFTHHRMSTLLPLLSSFPDETVPSWVLSKRDAERALLVILSGAGSMCDVIST